MKISYAKNRFDKNMINTEISWQLFCERVSKTVYLNETEALLKEKNRKDCMKDVGGFIGGHLRDGCRKKGNVLCRSMIVLDMDNGVPGIDDKLFALYNFAFCIYSTYSHTENQPRFRIVIPLKSDVNETQYVQIAKYLTSIVGKEMFDVCSYEPERLMFWPSTPVGEKFIFKEKKGDFLSPESVVSNNEIKTGKTVSENDASDDDRVGFIQIFCNAYSISEAIFKFIPDVYISDKAGRYRYAGTLSPPGVVITDDQFLYSYHSSDPAYGKMLNSFDLIRIHKFSHLDKNMDGDCVYNERPSYYAMLNLAKNDEKVINLIKKHTVNWRQYLEYDKDKNIKNSFFNIVTILRNDENLKNIVFNVHMGSVFVCGDVPWTHMKPGWSDSDAASLKVYLNENYGIYVGEKIKDAVLAVATERRYHPVIEYIESLPMWDGISRIETILITYLGAEDNLYVRAVTKKTLIAAIARVLQPGIKFDNVLILSGPQGIGKSTLFSKLGNKWFSDSLTISDMKDKSAAEKLQGYWILELGELSGIRKTEIEVVKSFVSRVDDKYRASYGANVESHPRQCIIVGTTNSESGFLRDITGNRRFWPVSVKGDSAKKVWEISDAEISQIWAEAFSLYNNRDFTLFLDDESVIELADMYQNCAMENDDREGLVRKYLEIDLPKDWELMSLQDRRVYLSNPSSNREMYSREFVCNMEIWSECFCREPTEMKKTDSYEISAIMRRIDGWSSTLSERLHSYRLYGKQRVYKKL